MNKLPEELKARLRKLGGGVVGTDFEIAEHWKKSFLEARQLAQDLAAHIDKLEQDQKDVVAVIKDGGKSVHPAWDLSPEPVSAVSDELREDIVSLMEHITTGTFDKHWGEILQQLLAIADKQGEELAVKDAEAANLNYDFDNLRTAKDKEIKRLQEICKQLVGEETLHQDGQYETEMQKLNKQIEQLQSSEWESQHTRSEQRRGIKALRGQIENKNESIVRLQKELANYVANDFDESQQLASTSGVSEEFKKYIERYIEYLERDGNYNSLFPTRLRQLLAIAQSARGISQESKENYETLVAERLRLIAEIKELKEQSQWIPGPPTEAGEYRIKPKDAPVFRGLQDYTEHDIKMQDLSWIESHYRAPGYIPPEKQPEPLVVDCCQPAIFHYKQNSRGEWILGEHLAVPYSPCTHCQWCGKALPLPLLPEQE